MGYNREYKRLDELEIAELACNKSLDEIQDLYEILKQSIRMYLSRLLYYTDDDKQLECDITLSLSNSSNGDRITISHMWQDPIEGLIRLVLSPSSVTPNTPKPVLDLDDLVIEDQIYMLWCWEESW